MIPDEGDGWFHVAVFHMNSKKLLRVIETDQPATQIAFTTDGEKLLTITEGETDFNPMDKDKATDGSSQFGDDGARAASPFFFSLQSLPTHSFHSQGFGRCDGSTVPSASPSSTPTALNLPPGDSLECGLVSDGKGGALGKTCLDGQCCSQYGE